MTRPRGYGLNDSKTAYWLMRWWRSADSESRDRLKKKHFELYRFLARGDKD